MQVNSIGNFVLVVLIEKKCRFILSFSVAFQLKDFQLQAFLPTYYNRMMMQKMLKFTAKYADSFSLLVY